MRHTRTRRTTATALAMTLAIATIGGGGAARQAHANPPLNRTPTSESVDGFTLSPTKGPANTAGTHTTITPPASGITFTQISAGSDHSLAIGSDGNTYAWGYNNVGQLGTGTGGHRDIPVRVRTPAGVRFTQVSAGGGIYESLGNGFSLAIGDDGHAYGWGWNRYGQLGDGTNTARNTPVRVTDPAPDTTWRTISAGEDHSLAIDNHGHAYSWGFNRTGRLGNGSDDFSAYYTPARVKDPAGQPDTTWRAISAGGQHSLGIDSNGHAYGWGFNQYGEVGDGSDIHKFAPVRVTDPAPGTTWTAISAGDNHSLGIDNQGHAYFWGNYQNTPVRLTGPTPNTTWTAISAGDGRSLGIDSNGHAYDLSFLNQPAQPTDPTCRAISAGKYYSLVLDSQGHIYSWGSNRYGQLGNGRHGTNPPAYDNADSVVMVRVATPRYTITGAAVDGTPIGARDRSVDPATGAWDITLPSRAPGRVNITVDYRYEGLDANNNVIAGNGSNGSVTLHYTYATQYTVRFSLGDAAGHTSSPTPADQTVYSDDPKPISWPQDPEWEHHWLTGWAKADGSSWDFNTPVTSSMTLTAQWQAWQFTLNPTSGPDTAGNTLHITPPPNPPLPRFTQISAGELHTLAIGSDGNTYAWGENGYGQLGDGTTTDHNQPVRVRTPAGVHFTQVSAGDQHSLAIGDDGHAYSWGDNSHGQLGNGSSDTNPHPTPARVTDPTANTTWTTISTGRYHSLAIDSDGHAYSWGTNNTGQLGNGNSDLNPHPTPARVTDPTANTTWTTISAGQAHSLAID
ncbi:RCC1 domain-containing protein, partial [Bifidobacterium xylocopae]